MRRCWHARAKKRPSMAQICTALSAAVGGEGGESEYGDLLAVYPECQDVEVGFSSCVCVCERNLYLILNEMVLFFLLSFLQTMIV